MSNCKLCNKQKADKRNSHIIPKFMGKGLFEKSKPRHGIQIDRKGKSKKIQDSPKEHFIFCMDCEKRFEVLETYFSRKIIDIHNYKNLKEKFQILEFGETRILNCLKVNPTSFKLFVYSMIWRASISDLAEFKNFKLSSPVENELKTFLDQHLKIKQSDLIESFRTTSSFPNYNFCVMKPETKNEDSRGIFSAYEFNKDSFGLFLVDLNIFFYPSENRIPVELKTVSNKQNEKVFIILSPLNKWGDLHKSIIKRLLQNSS